MEYKARNYSEIGNRIAKYRKSIVVQSSHGKQKTASQTDLLGILKDKGLASIGRNTLSDLENGVESAFNGMTLKQWDSLCTVFGCSLGHLMGEYESSNYDIEFVRQYTGLTEQSIKVIKDFRRDNQTEWLLDGCNAFIEHSEFPFLIHYLLSYAIAGNKTSKDIVPVSDSAGVYIKFKDVYQMNMNDSLKEIAKSITAQFEGRSDYRWLYRIYLSLYQEPDKDGKMRSIDAIREEMIENGLDFDPHLFEGRDRNGND